MKQLDLSFMARALLCATFLIGAYGAGSSGSPLQKVISLMTQLQGQVIGEGELSQQTYKKYSNWCERTSTEKQFEITQGMDSKSDMEAAIEKSISDSEDAKARVEELSGGLATDGQDVKAIALIRGKEKNEFEEMDKELTATISTISKARSVLKKELEKATPAKAASFLQNPTKGMKLFALAANTLATAAMGVSADSQDRLAELLQIGDQATSDSQDQDASEEDGAPAKPVYQTKSGSILDLLEKMEGEVEESQAKNRKKESTEKHNFELLKGRLDDRIATQTKELEAQKKELASAKEIGATSKGKLDSAAKGLEEDKKFLKKLQQGCMERASEFEASMKTRNDELEALGSAKKTVQSIVFAQVSSSSDMQEDTDVSAASFVQVTMASGAEVYALKATGVAVASRLHQMASDEHSVALAQLSSRVTKILKSLHKMGFASGDPFKKIKNLISNMIEKLEKQQAEESRQKAFCDKEMAESIEGKEDREGTIETLSTHIEEAASDVAKLNQQRTELLNEISGVESSQGEMDALRKEEHDTFHKVSKELNEGLAGIGTALKVLRDFYSQNDEEGASLIQDMGASMETATRSRATYGGSGGGTAIIGLLEVCQSDFSKGLSEAEAEEDAAQDKYEKLTQENKVERATKDKAVASVGSEIARLEKKNSEFTGDRTEVQQELDALLEYFAKLKKQCVAQPESFHDRVARRKREIQGLQQALNMLMSNDGQTEE